MNNQNIQNRQMQPNILFYLENCKTCNVFINLAQKTNVLKHFKMICIDGQKEKFVSQGLKKVPTIIIPSINKQFEGNECLQWLDEIIKSNSQKNNLSQLNSNEMYVPDVGLVIGQNQQPNNINFNKNSSNSLNNHISQLSNQISQLSNQLGNNLTNTSNTSNVSKSSNQFEVPKTNLIKRNTISIQPPTINSNQKIRSNTLNNQISQNNQNQSLNGPTVKPVNQLFGYLQSEMSGFSDGYAYISIDNPLPKSFLPPDKDMEIYTAPEGDKINKKKQDEMIKNIEMQREDDKNKFIQSIDDLKNKIALGDTNSIPKWFGSNQNL